MERPLLVIYLAICAGFLAYGATRTQDTTIGWYNPPPASRTSITTPAATPTRTPFQFPTAQAPSPDPEVYYVNCDAVRAAGAAPLYRGDPGFGSHLDGDGDGVACE